MTNQKPLTGQYASFLRNALADPGPTFHPWDQTQPGTRWQCSAVPKLVLVAQPRTTAHLTSRTRHSLPFALSVPGSVSSQAWAQHVTAASRVHQCLVDTAYYGVPAPVCTIMIDLACGASWACIAMPRGPGTHQTSRPSTRYICR